jgi:hypothetical protein
MHFDINNPKFRYAQHLANSMQVDQVIVKNMFGDYDIKRASSVIIINNPDLVCIVEPMNRRQKNGELEFDCVLN